MQVGRVRAAAACRWGMPCLPPTKVLQRHAVGMQVGRTVSRGRPRHAGGARRVRAAAKGGAAACRWVALCPCTDAAGRQRHADGVRRVRAAGERGVQRHEGGACRVRRRMQVRCAVSTAAWGRLGTDLRIESSHAGSKQTLLQVKERIPRLLQLSARAGLGQPSAQGGRELLDPQCTNPS